MASSPLQMSRATSSALACDSRPSDSRFSPSTYSMTMAVLSSTSTMSYSRQTFGWAISRPARTSRSVSADGGTSCVGLRAGEKRHKMSGLSRLGQCVQRTLDHRQCPLLVEELIGSQPFIGRGDVDLDAHQIATALLGPRAIALVGHEVLERG